MKPEIVGTITDDLEIKFSIPHLYKARLAQIGKGERVRVEISKWYKKRTKQQNNYLWGVVYPAIIKYIKETTGQEFSNEDLHERYKRKYLGYERCEIIPDLIKTKSSTELDTQEFWDQLIEHICREWAELGLYIPLPENSQYDKRGGR